MKIDFRTRCMSITKRPVGFHRINLSRAKRVSIVSGKIVICLVPSELFLRKARVNRPTGKGRIFFCRTCAQRTLYARNACRRSSKTRVRLDMWLAPGKFVPYKTCAQPRKTKLKIVPEERFPHDTDNERQELRYRGAICTVLSATVCLQASGSKSFSVAMRSVCKRFCL